MTHRIGDPAGHHVGPVADVLDRRIHAIKPRLENTLDAIDLGFGDLADERDFPE